MKVRWKMKITLQKTLILLIVGVILLSGSIFIIKYQVWESNKVKNNHTFLVENKIREENEIYESLRKKLGQNLIVGIPGPALDEKTKEILHYIKPAGIVLYRRNYESFSQLKDLIAQLQRISIEDTGVFYFIMLDEEPDGAMRLGLLKNIFPLGLADWKKIEKDIEVLADIGINVELAPIADFPFNNDAFVKRRVQAKNVEDLTLFNRTFIQLLKEYKISATLKHFPGMGIFIEDPHRKIPNSNIQQEVLDKSLKIFKDGIDHGADFVMTAHAVYENIDHNNPATFSSKIVKDLLIDRLGFRGIIVTDDLSDMPLAIKEINLVDAGIRALKAGHHLIMYSHKLEKTKDIFDEIFSRMKTDSELQSIIENNYQKNLDFKKSAFFY
jgi:beta-N-acetylhexosaminidase